MSEMSINSSDEDFLLALESGSKKRKVLTSSLILSDNMFQKRAAKLMKNGLLTKSKVGFYVLTGKGKKYVKALIEKRRENVQREKEEKKAALRQSELPKRDDTIPPRDAAELWADALWKGFTFIYKKTKRFFATHTKKNPSSSGPGVQGENVSPQEKKHIQDEDGFWWTPKI